MMPSIGASTNTTPMVMLQRTSTMVYDAVSNVLSAANGLGVVTQLQYDVLNRQTAQLDAYGTGLATGLDDGL